MVSASQDEITFPRVGMAFKHATHKWKVERCLYTGPFSDVFVLIDAEKPNRKFAMKVERVKDIVRPVLKLDALVLPQMNGSRGFPEVVASGRTPTFKYLVMQLVGPDLAKLKSIMPMDKFSFATSLNVALQSLTLLESLHDAGWLCRDVKAPNFAIGRGEDSKTVYMLDFGFARRFKTRDNKERLPPRQSAACLGTFIYASIATLTMREQCPRDDLESWFYMLVELVTGPLPWRELPYRSILEYKQHIRMAGYREFFAQLPPQFKDIMRSIDSIGFYDHPDYELLRYLVVQAAHHLQADLNEPLDWVKHPMYYEKAANLVDSDVPESQIGGGDKIVQT